MFTCVALGEMPDEPLFYRDGESYLPVELFPGTRSAPMFLRKSEVFSLFVAKVTDEQTTYREVGRSKLIPETRRLLFLLDEVANAAEMKLRIIAIDDSLKAFPPGTFRFFNFTSTKLQVRLAGQVAGIDPGKMEVVKSRVDDQGAFVPFLIGDQKGKVIFETRLFGQPTGREMVFIGKPSKPGEMPKVKFLTQIIPRKLPVETR
ncbi:MAG: hypothetical protein NWT08_07205 [Akkermansiaceae bacterium]|nr:hypothetical protein [Akkermansiaceae bacterium]MDP4645885.1 hypothetical protein [Akkermansiaceae bacterium]MDP4779205.1 hypothetical protein [Akkermansiaceae bacterium]MDP4848181.1 hypothetical protein [Akkermansiaceae bacterium]MDP4898541.1 hypothetical protein [Akkermansiaceae bacterium]